MLLSKYPGRLLHQPLVDETFTEDANRDCSLRYMTAEIPRSRRSGRRTSITNEARAISAVGSLLADVQWLAGGSVLSTTEHDIQAETEAH